MSYQKETFEKGISGLLSKDSHFDGEIYFEGIIRIEGSMTGRLICKKDKPSTVIISVGATVDADILADIIIISGGLIGNIYALEKIEVKSLGRLEGRVYAGNMVIEKGALFQGDCIMISHYSDSEKNKLKESVIDGREVPLNLPEKQKLISLSDEEILTPK